MTHNVILMINVQQGIKNNIYIYIYNIYIYNKVDDEKPLI